MAKRAMASRESSSDAGEASAMQLEAHAPCSKDGAQEPPPVPAPSVFVFGVRGIGGPRANELHLWRDAEYARGDSK